MARRRGYVDARDDLLWLLMAAANASTRGRARFSPQAFTAISFRLAGLERPPVQHRGSSTGLAIAPFASQKRQQQRGQTLCRAAARTAISKRNLVNSAAHCTNYCTQAPRIDCSASKRASLAALQHSSTRALAMDADDERLTDWGASRRTYYGGDTADLEIGQKDEDAVEEEALARAQQREALEALDEDDFALDGGDDDEVEEESGDLFAAPGGRAALEKVSTAKLSRSELWRCSRRPSRAPSQVRQS